MLVTWSPKSWIRDVIFFSTKWKVGSHFTDFLGEVGWLVGTRRAMFLCVSAWHGSHHGVGWGFETMGRQKGHKWPR